MAYGSAAEQNDERRQLAYDRSAVPREYYPPKRAKCPLDESIEVDQPMLLRRPDVEAALRDWETYSSDFAGIMGSEEPIIPLNVDPPLHVRYRRMLDPYFAPRKMAALQPAVQRHTNELIDGFIDRGSCDFSTDIAVPLPCATFLTLFGLPLDEIGDLVRWKDIMIRPEHVVADPDAALKLQADTAKEIYARFGAEVNDRRTTPRDDFITHLTQCELDGEKLSDSEILRTCFLMLAAGLDTVTISLQCIFHFLVHHHDARQMLVDEPGSEISLIEELLRWETPVVAVSRRLTKAVELDGCVLAKDQQVWLGLGSVNIDPDGLPGADTVDVRRSDMRSWAFGGGPHRCLGSNLARMELRTVVRTWHDRIPDFQLAPNTELIWNGSNLRGIDHMPLVWAPTRSHST